MRELPPEYTGPALMDLQLNGYAGFDFNGDPASWTREKLHHVRSALGRRGVMAALPTLITSEAKAMLARAGRYAELVSGDLELESCFPRLHIEGPFISPHDGPRGAHPKRYCRLPRELPDFVQRLVEASGDRIGIVTLAPELPGAIELIRECVDAHIGDTHICVAIGHTRATATQLDTAVAAGTRMATHLGNGADALLGPADNYIQTQLADDRLWASFIADGHHMPMTTLKNFIRAKTPHRAVLVTDAIAAADMGPGQYEVGGEIVEADADGRVAKPGASNLAGSALTLDQAVINVCKHCNVPFEQAWAMASTNPATLLGMPALPTITVAVSEKGFRRTDG